MASTLNPTIFNWLKGISTGKDLLSGAKASVSDAIGGKALVTTPGNKDYKQAMFEKRVGEEAKLFNADEWVKYGERRFKQALTRTADTPDDPTTPKVNESSKTSIKLK